MPDFGQLVQLHRQAQLISVPELADACGVTPETVEGWEQGEDPDLGAAARAAEALGVSLDHLAGA
jgi:transcriptional regulator with XRE-family HTH domain